MDDMLSISQILLGLGALCLAYRESSKWREELVGRKRIELMIKLGGAAIDIHEDFRILVSPARFSDIDYKAVVEQTRLKLHDLYPLAWEAEIILGGGFRDIALKYTAELRIAADIINNENKYPYDVGQQKMGEIGKLVEELTNQILDQCRMSKK
jgi:hypothetical protein